MLRRIIADGEGDFERGDVAEVEIRAQLGVAWAEGSFFSGSVPREALGQETLEDAECGLGDSASSAVDRAARSVSEARLGSVSGWILGRMERAA